MSKHNRVCTEFILVLHTLFLLWSVQQSRTTLAFGMTAANIRSEASEINKELKAADGAEV